MQNLKVGYYNLGVLVSGSSMTLDSGDNSKVGVLTFLSFWHVELKT